MFFIFTSGSVPPFLQNFSQTPTLWAVAFLTCEDFPALFLPLCRAGIIFSLAGWLFVDTLLTFLGQEAIQLLSDFLERGKGLCLLAAGVKYLLEPLIWDRSARDKYCWTSPRVVVRQWCGLTSCEFIKMVFFAFYLFYKVTFIMY